jgi:hypothetical protein
VKQSSALPSRVAAHVECWRERARSDAVGGRRSCSTIARSSSTDAGRLLSGNGTPPLAIIEVLRNDAGIAALAKALAHSDLSIRRNAVLALMFMGQGFSEAGRAPRVDIRSSVEALIRALEDEDEHVRAWAVLAIGTTEPHSPDTLTALVRKLEDPSPAVRHALCGRVFAHLDRAASARRLATERLASDSDANVRHCATNVLGRPPAQ